MNKELVAEIAKLQAGQWTTIDTALVLMMTLTAVVCAAAAFAAPYLAKRGEIQATKDKFEEILDQLRKNTEASEQIRTQIAHQEWAAREWKAGRARKLEEFLATVNTCYEWLEAALRLTRMGESIELWKEDPAARALIIQVIYFPDLKEPYLAFGRESAGALEKLHEIGDKQDRLKAKGRSQAECVKEMAAEYGAQADLMYAAQGKLFDLINSASIVLDQIYGPRSSEAAGRQIGNPR